MGDGASMFYDANCSVCGIELKDIPIYEPAICSSCSHKREREEREREREEQDAKRQNETHYDVHEYKYSWMSGTEWKPMKVFLNTTDKPNYIRFGADSDSEILLRELIVSPQKKKYGGLGTRNTEGHEDAHVFRARGSKFFLDVTEDLLSALRGTADVKVMDQPYSPSGGGGKKKRRKYSKKYTKRRKSNKRKSKTKRRRRR